MRKQITLAFCLLLTSCSFAQHIRVPLTDFKYAASPFYGSVEQTYKISKDLYPQYKWPSDLRQVLLLRYHAHIAQHFYEQTSSGKRTQASYTQMMRNYDFDSSWVSPQPLQEYIDMLSAVNADGDTICIIDGNGDKDFLNDIVYYKKNVTNDTQRFTKATAVTIYHKGVYHKQPSIYIQPYFENPFISKSDSTYTPLHITVVARNYKTGTAIVSGKKINFALKVDRSMFVFTRHLTKIFYAQASDTFPKESDKNTEPNAIGDTIRIGKHFYRLDSITPFGEALYLRRIKPAQEKGYGFNTGYTAQPFSATDIITGQALSSEKFKTQNKYLLIDFWGTWCHPCIKALPDLQQLYKDCKDKNIEMLSVACENEMDTAKVRAAIAEHGIAWHNIMEDKLYKNNQAHQLQKNFRISFYPTLLLIAPDGRIAARETGTDGTKRMVQKIKQLLR